MKDILIILVTNISSILATAVAGLLAYEGKDGWGWFLFMSAILSSSFYHAYQKEDKEEE